MASLANPLQSVGTVVESTRMLDLKVFGKVAGGGRKRPKTKIVRGVPSEALWPEGGYLGGDWVVHKASGWVGQVSGGTVVYARHLRKRHYISPRMWRRHSAGGCLRVRRKHHAKRRQGGRCQPGSRV